MSDRIGARALAGIAALSAALGAGCGGGAAARMAEPPVYAPKDEAKCSIMKSASRPLIVEWPAADRAALEAQAKKGLVAVRYEGCRMEVLRQCRVHGAYGYTPITRKDDHVAIRTTDDLYANVPVHAAALEGKLASAGRLDVDMAMVGVFEAPPEAVEHPELDGDCHLATHVVSAMTAGAFELSAGGAASVSGGVALGGLGAGAGEKAEKETLNRDGDRDACAAATTDDTRPPPGCGALIRLEVAPIHPPTETVVLGALSAPAAPRPPPPPPEDPPSWQRTTGNVAVGLGTAGILAWGVAGFVLIGEKSSLQSTCRDGSCPLSAADTLSAYHTWGTVATASLLGGAGLLGAGIVLRAFAPKGSDSSAAVVVGPGGVAIRGALP